MDFYTDYILTVYVWLCAIYDYFDPAPNKPPLPLDNSKYYEFESIWVICIIIVGFWSINMFLRRWITDLTARWYMLHCITNACVVWYACANFCQIIANPNNIFHITPTYSPLNVTIALHIFHMLFFNNLIMIDWIHHIVMISIAIISYCYSAPVIVATNGLLMFLNGLPGCIDYFLLSLVKTDKIKSMTEKYINIYLNLYIRSPGVVITTYILYLTFQKTQEVNWYMQCIAYIILLWNSQYFLLRVIGNYVARLFNKKKIIKEADI